MPSLSLILMYSYVFPCSHAYISLLKSSIKFCESTNFRFFSTILAHLSSPNSIWISSLQVLTTCICFSPISCKSPVYNKCALLLFLCCVLCISCVQLVQLLCEQIKLKQNSSNDRLNESPWSIPRCVAMSPVSVRFPSAHKQILLFQ